MYFDDVYRYLLSLSGSESVAEELTSETFFRAMDALDHFRGECSVRVWLCQIAKNLYYSQLRREKRLDWARCPSTNSFVSSRSMSSS